MAWGRERTVNGSYGARGRRRTEEKSHMRHEVKEERSKRIKFSMGYGAGNNRGHRAEKSRGGGPHGARDRWGSEEEGHMRHGQLKGSRGGLRVA